MAPPAPRPPPPQGRHPCFCSTIVANVVPWSHCSPQMSLMPLFCHFGYFLAVFVTFWPQITFFLLQHHCRKCGSVVCASCSSQKFLMPAQSSKPLRVCDPCYATLSKTKTTAVGGTLAVSSTVEGKQNLKSSEQFPVLISRNVLKALVVKNSVLHDFGFGKVSPAKQL